MASKDVSMENTRTRKGTEENIFYDLIVKHVNEDGAKIKESEELLLERNSYDMNKIFSCNTKNHSAKDTETKNLSTDDAYCRASCDQSNISQIDSKVISHILYTIATNSEWNSFQEHFNHDDNIYKVVKENYKKESVNLERKKEIFLSLPASVSSQSNLNLRNELIKDFIKYQDINKKIKLQSNGELSIKTQFKKIQLYMNAESLANEIEKSHNALDNFLISYKLFSENRKYSISLLKQCHEALSNSLIDLERNYENKNVSRANKVDLFQHFNSREYLMEKKIAALQNDYFKFPYDKLSKYNIGNYFLLIQKTLLKDFSCLKQVYRCGEMCSSIFKTTRRSIQAFLKEILETNWKTQKYKENIFQPLINFLKWNPDNEKKEFEALKFYFEELNVIFKSAFNFSGYIRPLRLNREKSRSTNKLSRVFFHSSKAVEYIEFLQNELDIIIEVSRNKRKFATSIYCDSIETQKKIDKEMLKKSSVIIDKKKARSKMKIVKDFDSVYDLIDITEPKKSYRVDRKDSIINFKPKGIYNYTFPLKTYDFSQKEFNLRFSEKLLSNKELPYTLNYFPVLNSFIDFRHSNLDTLKKEIWGKNEGKIAKVFDPAYKSINTIHYYPNKLNMVDEKDSILNTKTPRLSHLRTKLLKNIDFSQKEPDIKSSKKSKSKEKIESIFDPALDTINVIEFLQKELNKVEDLIDKVELSSKEMFANEFYQVRNKCKVIDFLFWIPHDFQSLELKKKRKTLQRDIELFSGDKNFNVEIFLSKIENIILGLEEEESILNEAVASLRDDDKNYDFLRQYLGDEILNVLTQL